MTRRLCRGTPLGRPTVSGWSTRATVREMPTCGSSVLGDPDPTRLTTSEANESQPQWSPDGQSIVFRSERDGGGLYVIPASGGVERIVSSFGYEPPGRRTER